MNFALTDKEIEKVGEDAFRNDALLDHYVNSRGHWEKMAPFIAKALLGKIGNSEEYKKELSKIVCALSGQPDECERCAKYKGCPGSWSELCHDVSAHHTQTWPGDRASRTMGTPAPQR